MKKFFLILLTVVLALALLCAVLYAEGHFGLRSASGRLSRRTSDSAEAAVILLVNRDFSLPDGENIALLITDSAVRRLYLVTVPDSAAVVTDGGSKTLEELYRDAGLNALRTAAESALGIKIPYHIDFSENELRTALGIGTDGGDLWELLIAGAKKAVSTDLKTAAAFLGNVSTNLPERLLAAAAESMKDPAGIEKEKGRLPAEAAADGETGEKSGMTASDWEISADYIENILEKVVQEG